MIFARIEYKWAALASLVLIAYLWFVPWQTQDGPNHKKVAVVLERLSQSPSEHAVYQSRLGPLTTNSLFPLLYKAGGRWLSPDQFEKIFIWFFLSLFFLSYWVFLKAWDPDALPFWVLVLPLSFHPLFIRGMYNFMASVPLTLIALTFLRYGLQDKEWRYLAYFGLTAWIAYLSHPFPFFILACSYALMLAFDVPVRQWVRTFPYGIVIMAFLVFGFVIPLFQASTQSFLQPYYFKPWTELVLGLFAYNFVGFSVPQMIPLALFFVSLLALMIFSLLRTSWKYKIFWIAFLILYFAFPDEGKGGAHLNQRFLPYVILFLPLGIALSKRVCRSFQWLTLLTAVYLAAGVFWGMTRVEADVKDARAVLRELPAKSTLYPINFDMHGPGLTYNSLRHLWANYKDDRIVFSPYLFAYMDLMPISLRRTPSESYFPSTPEDLAQEIARGEICTTPRLLSESECKERKQEAQDKILANAFYYDYWYLHDPPKQFLFMLEVLPDLSLVSQKNKSSLWRNGFPKPFSPPLRR